MRHRLFQTFSLKHLDFILLALVAALNGIGIAAIGSAEHDLQGKQMEGLILGFVVAVFLSALLIAKSLQGISLDLSGHLLQCLHSLQVIMYQPPI